MRHQLPWLRIFAEGVAIVVSILLAFGIQAWWDGRLERRAEQHLLGDLLADFREARDALASGIEDHQHAFDAALKLTALLEGEARDVSEAELVSRVRDALGGYVTTGLRTGALDGALASDALSLVSDADLRSLLATRPRSLVEFTEQEAYIAVLDGEWNRLASNNLFASVARSPQQTRRMRSNRELLLRRFPCG